MSINREVNITTAFRKSNSRLYETGKRAISFAQFCRCEKKIFRRGFTLVELMVASIILSVTIGGILISFLKSVELTEISRNHSVAIQTARSRMEQIKATAFGNILADYGDKSFTVPDLRDGWLFSYVDNTDPDLLLVTVTVCWREKNGRVYGEDADLDGLPDAGEDINGDGMLNSPVELVMYIFRNI